MAGKKESAKERAATPVKWYSIKEAAAYLDIGEPTLYRWMQERRITFRKVGNSTRFTREDLDAVVEVHHSEKSVDAVRRCCPACHHPELVPGALRSTGLIYFQPQKVKFWTLRDSSVRSTGLMCPACGCIALFGDTGKLEKLLKETPEAAGSRE